MKITAKSVREYQGKKLAIPYCEAQSMLYYQDKYGYNSGIYGWNFNAYYVNGVIITTGYRNLVGDNAKNLGEYEAKAKAILKATGYTIEEREAAVNAVLYEFLAQA
jgi:hypothetical protein